MATQITDQRALRFIHENMLRIGDRWEREAVKSGLDVGTPKDVMELHPWIPAGGDASTRIVMPCRRKGTTKPTYYYFIMKLIIDIAVTDRDDPVYDERLADLAYREAKEERLIQGSLVSLHTMLSMPEDITDKEAADVMWQAHEKSGHPLERLRVLKTQMPRNDREEGGETDASL